MEHRTITCLSRWSRLRAAAYSAFLMCFASPIAAHPHVFVDGGIDFVFSDEGMLEALELTWLYDEFETLYLVSRYGLSLNSKGELDEEARLELVTQMSVFPEDFDGSAHVSVDDTAVGLEWPKDVDAHLVDGRLQLTFVRDLTTPLRASGQEIKAAFYESTYFFAFKVTTPPKLTGGADTCEAEVIPFSPDPNDASVFAQLAALSREETPADQNVGAQFADRITVRCD